jgi:hypothetical protein
LIGVRAFGIWILVGCTPPASTHIRNQAQVEPSRQVSDARCGMIEAAVQTAEIKNFACGEAATQDGRLIVDAHLEPPLTTRCTSDLFETYQHGQPMNTDALLQLWFKEDSSDTWSVSASFIDPPNSPGDTLTDDGFDDTNYYCGLAGVRVTRTKDGWRGWYDPTWWRR